MTILSGKTVVITGAASGIGRSLAFNMANEGCNLALVDVNKAGLEETASAVLSQNICVTTHVVDVSNRETFRLFAKAAIEVHGEVDIVINNAGVNVSAGFLDISYEDFDWITGVNYLGVIHGIKEFLPQMVERGEGHIVNVSSAAGYFSANYMGMYCATKHAVRAVSEALLAELNGTGVAVTSVHPGAIDTNIVSASRVSEKYANHRNEITRKMEDASFVVTSADKAAKKIVHAVKTNKFKLFIGVDSYIAYLLSRLMPMTFNRCMSRATNKMHANHKIGG